MPLGVYTDGPEKVGYKEYPESPLKPDQVRLRTEFAAIKHGTELHVFSGTSPFRDRSLDPNLRLFMPASNGGGDGIVRRFVGNMVVGRVTEIGPEVSNIAVGDRVYGFGPLAQTATLRQRDAHPLVEPLRPEDAVCQDPALFAYAAVRDAEVRLGDNVVVLGLGAIGLLTVQMLRLAGALNVVAIDPIEKRRVLAARYGATLTLDPTSCDVGVEVHKALGVGADTAIECSGSYRALAAALRCVRQCARVVTVGYYKGTDNVLELGAEWHHNRLELRSSLPDWGNPSREHPLWDRERMIRTCLELFRLGQLTSDGIVDPIVDFQQAAEAFAEAYHRPQNAVKLGVRF